LPLGFFIKYLYVLEEARKSLWFQWQHTQIISEKTFWYFLVFCHSRDSITFSRFIKSEVFTGLVTKHSVLKSLIISESVS
jgi:hypothetical protein